MYADKIIDFKSITMFIKHYQHELNYKSRNIG
jgi:hypothetical protein